MSWVIATFEDATIGPCKTKAYSGIFETLLGMATGWVWGRFLYTRTHLATRKSNPLLTKQIFFTPIQTPLVTQIYNNLISDFSFSLLKSQTQIQKSLIHNLQNTFHNEIIHKNQKPKYKNPKYNPNTLKKKKTFICPFTPTQNEVEEGGGNN